MEQVYLVSSTNPSLSVYLQYFVSCHEYITCIKPFDEFCRCLLFLGVLQRCISRRSVVKSACSFRHCLGIDGTWHFNFWRLLDQTVAASFGSASFWLAASHQIRANQQWTRRQCHVYCPTFSQFHMDSTIQGNVFQSCSYNSAILNSFFCSLKCVRGSYLRLESQEWLLVAEKVIL